MFDVEKIRKDFPMIMNHPDLIYFDSAATSFKPRSVIDTVIDYYEHNNCNIHRGDYDISFAVRKGTMIQERPSPASSTQSVPKRSSIPMERLLP